MSGILITKVKRTLPLDQQVFFLFLWGLKSAEDFPFASGGAMLKTWQKRRDYLLSLMYRDRDDPIFGGGMYAPAANCLRPKYWWYIEGPERLILNGVMRIEGNRKFGFFYDRQPALESESECLARNNLLTQRDWEWRSDAFLKAESAAIAYRKYLLK